MSPSERRQFVVSFTWSWPAVIFLLVLAMIPVWGPLLPDLEGRVAPVTTKIEFITSTQVEGGLVVQMKYTKTRDCEYLGASVDNVMTGESVEFHPFTGPPAVGTWATGPHISRPWFIGAPTLDNLQLRWVHRCNPIYLTITTAFP